MTLEIRNPNIGDGISQNMHSINRTSRGGTRISYRDSDWLKTKRFTVSFEVLEDSEIEEVIDFIESTAGLLVTYTDYNGEQWDGYIVSPEIEKITNIDLCAYSCSFIFEVKNQDSCYMTQEDGDLLKTETGDFIILETCDG